MIGNLRDTGMLYLYIAVSSIVDFLKEKGDDRVLDLPHTLPQVSSFRDFLKVMILRILASPISPFLLGNSTLLDVVHIFLYLQIVIFTDNNIDVATVQSSSTSTTIDVFQNSSKKRRIDESDLNEEIHKINSKVY